MIKKIKNRFWWLRYTRVVIYDSDNQSSTIVEVRWGGKPKVTLKGVGSAPLRTNHWHHARIALINNYKMYNQKEADNEL